MFTGSRTGYNIREGSALLRFRLDSDPAVWLNEPMAPSTPAKENPMATQSKQIAAAVAAVLTEADARGFRPCSTPISVELVDSKSFEVRYLGVKANSNDDVQIAIFVSEDRVAGYQRAWDDSIPGYGEWIGCDGAEFQYREALS